MNQDQIKGNVKDAAAKLQRKTGEVTGNERQESKGIQKQVEAQVQKTVGNIKDTFNK
ncbi:MAG TPA: CsbD family protein [Noviherbaspirillum sp.]|jgi:uncharacterized protein YjbJ (UPF0337 family)|uniref:CsbD family protein n=1 Tax=Noviherbaspirillum sp. TaxID=1926288 RepID=UPI002F93A09F